jgi:hypothetical protein
MTERRRRRRPLGGRLRWAAGIAAVVVAAVLSGVLWSVPTVRTVLLQSFTERQPAFTELYFTAAPTFDGATVIVPLALNAHGTGIRSYQVRIALDDAKGRPLVTRQLTQDVKDGAVTPLMVRVQATGDVAGVRVALVGHPQTLHYAFGPASPSAKQ